MSATHESFYLDAAFAATTSTALFTVSAGYRYYITDVVICNSAESGTAYVTLQIDDGSGAITILESVEVVENDTIISTLGFAMADGDVLYAYTSAGVNLMVNGLKIGS